MKGSRYVLLLILSGLVLLAGAVSVQQASSSPGGLDARGGHHCWTSCPSRGLYRGQYHCHRSPCNRTDVLRHRRHGH